MENIFQKGNYRISGSKLLRELLKLRPRQCECCKLTEWLNEPIKLEVHHIDGDNTNNVLENLQLLCPNCHSYTESWCKTKPKAQVADEQLIEALKSSQSIHQALLKVGLSTAGVNYDRAKLLIQRHGLTLAIPDNGQYTNKFDKNYCLDCGIEITKGAKRCLSCASIAQQTLERPSREELKHLIRTNSFLAISRMYDNKITDNGIRRWCDAYGLPRTKKEIKTYSDEEWAAI